jgi:osmotically-inducible protein OsmY
MQPQPNTTMAKSSAKALVLIFNGVVQLDGSVNTNARRNRAGEVASHVVGVKGVENNLAVKEPEA